MVCTNHGVPTMKVLRLKPTMIKTGLPRSTIYLYIKNGTFPRPIKLGERSVAWIESELDAWLQARQDLRA